MNKKPNTPPDVFDRVARDLIDEILGDFAKSFPPEEYEQVVGSMIKDIRREPRLREHVERVCRFVV